MVWLWEADAGSVVITASNSEMSVSDRNSPNTSIVGAVTRVLNRLQYAGVCLADSLDLQFGFIGYYDTSKGPTSANGQSGLFLE